MRPAQTLVLAATGLAGFCHLAEAASFIFSPNAPIPSPLVTGLTDTRTVTTDITSIADLNVRLEIAGNISAINGDYVATLTHGDGFAVLLNRTGSRSGNVEGYPDNGFDVTLDDQAVNGDIHVYRFTLFGNHGTEIDPDYISPLTGSWVADGRTAGYDAVLDTSPRSSAPLADFNGLNPNGLWTLFVYDNASGGSGTLVSWTLDITPVPEPATVALVSGFALLGFGVLRCRFIAPR